MALDTTPRMLADPVAGFFAGFTSTIARLLIGLAGALFGFALCGFCAIGRDFDALGSSSFGLFFLGIFMIFQWATLGGWFVVGLASLISIFVCLWAFIHDSAAKLSYFLIFTSATVYFSPFTFSRRVFGEVDGNPLMWLLIIYAGLSACYWILPAMIARFTNRYAEDEIETADEQEEYPAGEEPAEASAEPVQSDEELPITGAEPLQRPIDEEETDT